MAKQQISAERVVVTSFLVDVSDVFFNVTVAVLSGSVVMLAEALQGAADLLTSALLYLGLKRSKRSPSTAHPFGHGRELFFWVLMAGISMFILTGTLSTYFGIQRLLNPEPVTHLEWSFLALIIGLATNAYAFRLSYLRLRASESIKSFWRLFRQSSLIETKATIILDLMGAMASALGIVALGFFLLTGNPAFDGLGAIVIGVSTAVLSIGLIASVKDLLIGRSASADTEQRIRRAALEIQGVQGVLDVYTMYLGSEQILAHIDVHMADNLTTDELEQLIDKVKARIQKRVPSVTHTQIELETPTDE